MLAGHAVMVYVARQPQKPQPQKQPAGHPVNEHFGHCTTSRVLSSIPLIMPRGLCGSTIGGWPVGWRIRSPAMEDFEVEPANPRFTYCLVVHGSSAIYQKCTTITFMGITVDSRLMGNIVECRNPG